jgi:hypothetical protein
MSYYFTCVALESGPIALPDGFTSHSLSTELLLVWQSTSPRVPVATDGADFVRLLSQYSDRFLYIIYDDGCGVREATIYQNGDVAQSFGEADELWVPLDDSGMPLAGATPIPVDNLDDNAEYDCVQDGISLGLESFCIAKSVSVAQIRQIICHG